MSVILAMLLGGAKRLLAFLRTLSFWQLACIALGFIAVLQTYRHRDARSDADRWERTYHAYRASQVAADKAQKETTARNIIVYRDRIVAGGKVAERIEGAPTPEGCKTAPEIMGADL